LTLVAAAKRPGLIGEALLLDPVVLPPRTEREAWSDRGPDLATLTRRRRAVYASREEAYAHFSGRTLFKAFRPEALALYVGDGGEVGEDEVVAAIGDNAELTLDEVAFAAAEGDAVQLERALTRAFGEGVQPVGLLRAELRHFQRLHLASSRLAAGRSEDEALKLRPPLFFKLVDRFKRQLRLWPPSRAEAALEALHEAEAQAKTTGLPAETICRAALMRIARGAKMARSR